MNKPEVPTHPGVPDISDEVRDELLRRLETYIEDKKSARPAKEVLEAMLRQPAADVTP